MTSDRFEATFVVHTDPGTAWHRLTQNAVDSRHGSQRLWLAGFDSTATVTSQEEGKELHATKDDEPCAGTNIVVKLIDHEDGTQITVVQSGFGDWMPPVRDMMAIGWRHIVADLDTYLHTGVHARRHLRPWGNLGAEVSVGPGALRIQNVGSGSIADQLSLQDDDLLVMLAGAPITNHGDLETALRVLSGFTGTISAELVRQGALISTSTVVA